MVLVRTDIDLSGIYTMVNTFEHGLADAERFAATKTREVIRREVIGITVRALCQQAGEGFPSVYTEHLVRHMLANTHVEALNFGRGLVEINTTFTNMGTYEDLATGFHDGALLAVETGAYGYGKLSGKPKYTIHPPQVTLPYQGEELMNDQERRQEFWEQAVVDGEPFQTNMRNLTVTAPSFEEVAYNRVSVWEAQGVAPQWLLLEYGYTESRPEVNSVDFTNSLETVINCVASEIYTGALTALIHLAQDSGYRVNVAGQPFRVIPGRGASYAPFKAEIEERIGDYSYCLYSY